MIDKNVISAVSPLKRKKSYKGGTKIKKAATKTAKRRGGFAESTATSNKPGYNVKTSFVARSGKAPAGTKTVPSPQKPYSYGKDGGIVINNYLDNKGGTGTQEQEQETTTNTPGTEGYWTYKDQETKKEVSGTTNESYKSHWSRDGERYKKTGMGGRMESDFGTQVIHKDFKAYTDYMDKVKAYNKTKAGREWSKKNRKSSSKDKTITTTERVKDKWIEGRDPTSTTTKQKQKLNYI